MTQPRAAHTGEEAEICHLDPEKFGVCRRRNQGVEVMVSQPQSVEIEELEMSENGDLDLGGESDKGGRTG